jgi:hypothetical protein
MPLTQAEAARLLSASTTQAAYAATTTSRLALCTTAPTNVTAGTAVSGGSYAPQNIAWYAPVQGTPTTTIANNGAVTFAGMPAVAGGVTHVEVYDTANAAVSSSARKWFGALTTARVTAAGDTLTFADSNLVLGLGVT